MFMCRIFSVFCANVLIAVIVEQILGVNCIFKDSRHNTLTPKFTFISNHSNFSTPYHTIKQLNYQSNFQSNNTFNNNKFDKNCVDKFDKNCFDKFDKNCVDVIFRCNSKNSGFEVEPENLTGLTTTDYKSTLETLEKDNVNFIDNLNTNSINSPNNTSSSPDTPETTLQNEISDNYFDWQSISDLKNSSKSNKSSSSTKSTKSTNPTDPTQSTKSTLADETGDKIVVKNVDGKRRDVVEGEKPLITGSGLNSELRVEDYEIGVSNGRINEWPVEWVPGRKVLSFIPIIIDQYSVNPNPIQIGFEDGIRFRGKHVESTFNSVIDTLNDKQIFGMCFLSPESMQLAPLAVYAELISKETVVDGSGENLMVTGRVLGRALINNVLMDEPFIKALVSPYEDEPRLHDPDNIPKLVDEIVNLYDNCNNAEAEIMELLQQPYAHLRVKKRGKLMDIIDDKLNKFNINNHLNQGFAQIAAYSAFDYHLSASERYDALAMQNTEDRLRFVRDTLKFKSKQLGVVKNSPKDRLEDLVKQLKNFQDERESIYSLTESFETTNSKSQ